MVFTFQTRVPLRFVAVFGDPAWIGRARVEPRLPPNRLIERAARVEVERTPLYRVVGEPEPVDVREEQEASYEGQSPIWTFADHLASFAEVVDHDPARYAPYTDLVCLLPGLARGCYLVEVR